MVGIPHSKGCKTCKKRKIKCDEQKPICGQCNKSARECAGYAQPTIFRHSSAIDLAANVLPPSQGQSTTHHTTESQQVKRNLTWVSASESPNGKRRTRPKRLKERTQQSRAAAAAVSSNLTLAQSSSAMLLRTPDPLILAVQSITGQFLETCCLPLSDTEEAPLSWLGEISERQNNHIDALPLAVSALALGWAGTVGSQPGLADKGLQLYSAAVRQLRADMRTCSPLQSLVVTAVFVSFELCQFGGGRNPGWLAHMQGVAAFLQALGPERVSVDPYLKIFTFCRVVFILQGLNRRRRVCAGSHMWIHGPFRNREKNAYHRFYDLAAEGCELLGQADGLLEPCEDEGGAERAEQVLGNTLDLISRLKQWMWDSNVVSKSRLQLSGPPRPPDDAAATKLRLDRARARGYPTSAAAAAASADSGQALYWQRMMHSYWALRLDLYMTILDNPVLMAALEDGNPSSSDLWALLIADLESPENSAAMAESIAAECRILANDVAVHCTDACSSSSQSFGSLVAVYTLETAIRWYAGHDGGDETDLGLERHCRKVLAGIRTEEAKGPCPFDASVLSDEVLRRGWC